jgi:diguanylate cyclase (GGDEF)-like protein
MTSAIDSCRPADVLLAVTEETTRRNLIPLLRLGGFAVRLARGEAEALAAIESALPDVVVADAELPDGTGYNLAEAVRHLPRGDQPVVVILGPGEGRCDRSAAIYCGADAALDRPIAWGDLARQLGRLHAGRKASRVLMVEDDARQAAFVRCILATEGYEVRWCDDPRRFAATLGEFRPDLVLMDVLLPGTTGYDLVRALRGGELHANLPVIFLTTEAQVSARIEAVRAGGDDHLVKPVPAQLLVSAIETRIERSRRLRSLLESDGLTRLLTQSAFLECTRAAAGAGGPDAHRQAIWVTIDLDHFKAINDHYGHAAGDRVLVTVAAFLRRHVRVCDVVGRCGGEELGLLFEGLAASDAVRLLDRLRREFGKLSFPAAAGPPFHATWSAGVASLAPWMSWEDWREAADRALYAAKRGGRNRVELASEMPQAAPAAAGGRARAADSWPPGPGRLAARISPACEPRQAEAG